MSQFARPDSNVTQTSFTGGFAELDESTPSDADFAWGADNSAAVLEVGLSDVTDPQVSTGHVLRVRLAKVDGGVFPGTGGNSLTITVEFFQGISLIATAVNAVTAPDAWTQTNYTLSGAEADAITNYADLRVRVTTTASGGSPANRRGGAVSWAELEVPDVSSGVSVTPGTLSLAVSAFAPLIVLGTVLTPAAASLVVSTFAPAVIVGTTLTPGTVALTLTTFAPAVAVSDNKTVAPSAASLAIATFAPTVAVSDNKQVTPGALALTTAGFAPAVSVGQVVVPAAASLAVTGSAPTVAVSDHKTVTPGLLACVVATFAPTVSVGSGELTPGTLALTITTFAPTVTASGGGGSCPGKVAALGHGAIIG